MVLNNWDLGDQILAADMNTYVRDHAQTALCVARATGTQVVAPNTTTGVLLAGTEDIDTDAIHSTSVLTNMFTPSYWGWYMLSGYAFVSANSSGNYAQLIVLKNAVADVTNSGWGYGFHRDLGKHASVPNIMPICSIPVWMNGTTDNLQVAVGFDSTANRTIENASVAVWRLRG